MIRKTIMTLALAGILALGYACKKDIGFLTVDDNAGYTARTLLVYIDPPSSSNQARYGTPYFTNSVEGVQGTLPLTYSLYEVHTDNGDAAKMKEQLMVQPGIGKIVIPVEHTIPAGSYRVSLTVRNSYGSHLLEDIVEITVQ